MWKWLTIVILFLIIWYACWLSVWWKSTFNRNKDLILLSLFMAFNFLGLIYAWIQINYINHEEKLELENQKYELELKKVKKELKE